MPALEAAIGPTRLRPGGRHHLRGIPPDEMASSAVMLPAMDLDGSDCSAACRPAPRRGVRRRLGAGRHRAHPGRPRPRRPPWPRLIDASDLSGRCRPAPVRCRLAAFGSAPSPGLALGTVPAETRKRLAWRSHPRRGRHRERGGEVGLLGRPRARAMALRDGRDLPAVVESGAYRFFAGDYGSGRAPRPDRRPGGTRHPRPRCCAPPPSWPAATVRGCKRRRRGAGPARHDAGVGGEPGGRRRPVHLLLGGAPTSPSVPPDADALKDQLAAGGAALVVGRELSGEVPEGAAVAVRRAFAVDGDERSLTLSHEGCPTTPRCRCTSTSSRPTARPSSSRRDGSVRLLSESGVDLGDGHPHLACAPVALRLDVYLDGAGGPFDAPAATWRRARPSFT